MEQSREMHPFLPIIFVRLLYITSLLAPHTNFIDNYFTISKLIERLDKSCAFPLECVRYMNEYEFQQEVTRSMYYIKRITTYEQDGDCINIVIDRQSLQNHDTSFKVKDILT